MNRDLRLQKIKEIGINIFKRVIVLVGSVITLQEMLTSFLFEFISQFSITSDLKSINKLMFLTIVIGGICIVIASIYEVVKRQAVINVETDSKAKIIIKLDSYEENMKKIIKETNNTDKDAIFVIGINDEINGTRAQKRGVHKAVIDKFYNTEESFNLFQQKTVEAFKKIDNTENSFGEIGVVKHNDNSKIMFVINSKNKQEENKSIIGPNPSEIIRKIFNSLENQEVDIVMMPIISSKNVVSMDNDNIRFSLIIAEIIEEYFKQLLNNRNINYDLVLSIRREDLEENSLSLGNIVRFIKELKPMYHIK